MKIAFWSPDKGQTGTTTNFAIVSVMMALEKHFNALLLENHYNPVNLETILARRDEGMVREEGYYYNQRGMEYFMRQLHSGKGPQTAMRQASISFIRGHIRYIPQSYICNKEVFAYQLQQMMFPVLRHLEAGTDYIGVDVESRGNASTAVLLEEADLVVVNLSQSGASIENFFAHYPSLASKALYMIGRYHAGEECSLERICKDFPIAKKSIGIIPYDKEFSDAVVQGRLISFLSKNYQCGSFDKKYAMMRECRHCAGLIAGKIQELKRNQSSS